MLADIRLRGVPKEALELARRATTDADAPSVDPGSCVLWLNTQPVTRSLRWPALIVSYNWILQIFLPY